MDPDRDEQDVPDYYWIEGAANNPDALSLYPTPNGAYTIQLRVLTFPDADSVAGFPTIMGGMLKDKALSIALPDLGFFQEGEYYRNRCMDAVDKMKRVYDDLQPEYIKRAGVSRINTDLESRIG
jgi:hypothetical protein